MIQSILYIWLNLSAPFFINFTDNISKFPQDTLRHVVLDEVVIENSRSTFDDRREFMILKRRVLKVYPYVDSLKFFMQETDSILLSTKKRRKHRRVVRKSQRNLIRHFGKNISNLTRKEGVILSKLIYRDFGCTAYDMISQYRGGMHAFFWQRISKLYEGNLKSVFLPEDNKEDFLIEKIISHHTFK